MRNAGENGDFNKGAANTARHELVKLRSRIFTPSLSPRDQWQQIIGTVQAPKNVANFSGELEGKGQSSEKNPLGFDDVEVYLNDESLFACLHKKYPSFTSL